MTKPRMAISRRLTIWLCSYLLIGTILFFYKGMPLGPILWAAPLTLVLTLLPYLFKKG